MFTVLLTVLLTVPLLCTADRNNEQDNREARLVGEVRRRRDQNAS